MLFQLVSLSLCHEPHQYRLCLRWNTFFLVLQDSPCSTCMFPATVGDHLLLRTHPALTGERFRNQGLHTSWARCYGAVVFLGPLRWQNSNTYVCTDPRMRTHPQVHCLPGACSPWFLSLASGIRNQELGAGCAHRHLQSFSPDRAGKYMCTPAEPCVCTGL